MGTGVILLSGGLDSAVSAYIARDDMGKRANLYGITIDYGQTHLKEIDCAVELGKSLDLLNHFFPVADLHGISKSALTGEGEIRQTGEAKDIPTTWVPQRNSIFLAMAFALAETVNADKIYTGFNQMDYSGYPDCRQVYVDQMARALNLASKRFVETGRGFGLITPIINKKKFEVVQIGTKLEVPFVSTWSCYMGGEKACGKCDSCRIRLEAFEKTGMTDPIEYERS